MVKTAVILAAGQGLKMAPYSAVRPKAMLPVANRPVIDYTVMELFEAGLETIIIAANRQAAQIRAWFGKEPRVRVVEINATSGTADTLLQTRPFVADGIIAVFYGDMLIPGGDIRRLLCSSVPSALVSPLSEQSQNVIGCAVDNGRVATVMGHPRNGISHIFAGFLFDRGVFAYLERNPGVFTEIQVGMMPPMESFLEMSVAEMAREAAMTAVCREGGGVFDLDKPWHILMANHVMSRKLTSALTENRLSEGASIHESACVDGYVQMGKGCHIGRNVIIKGNCIIGERTIIDNGAILMGENIIGRGCEIKNGCYLEQNAVVGDNCVVGHAAELSGVIFNRVYLCHYMEINGVVGENTDIGAATVCGSLRFDDGETAHRVLDRREIPRCCSNAVYIGDYCRTGVNASLMPGVKIGPYSIVGAGAVITGDVPERSLVYPKQEQLVKSWGPERYGW